MLGTGMEECLISGLLSVDGKKVLHLDRNTYYGGESASLDIRTMYKRNKETEDPNAAELGTLRDFAIDLIPKYIMASGKLVEETPVFS